MHACPRGALLSYLSCDTSFAKSRTRCGYRCNVAWGANYHEDAAIEGPRSGYTATSPPCCGVPMGRDLAPFVARGDFQRSLAWRSGGACETPRRRTRCGDALRSVRRRSAHGAAAHYGRATVALGIM